MLSNNLEQVEQPVGLVFFYCCCCCFFKLRVVKLQLLIEIDKLPDMQGTFAERKNMLVKKGAWYLHTTALGP